MHRTPKTHRVGTIIDVPERYCCHIIGKNSWFHNFVSGTSSVAFGMHATTYTSIHSASGENSNHPNPTKKGDPPHPGPNPPPPVLEQAYV